MAKVPPRHRTARSDPRSGCRELTKHLPVNVSTRHGRYRAHVMPLPVTVAHALSWRGVGDPNRDPAKLSSACRTKDRIHRYSDTPTPQVRLPS